jgi:hypothetical protein
MAMQVNHRPMPVNFRDRGSLASVTLEIMTLGASVIEVGIPGCCKKATLGH